MTDETKTPNAGETKTPRFDAADVARNPEKYGFRWNLRPLHRGTGAKKVLLREHVPHFEVPAELLDTFIRNFPDAVRSSFTTSLVVQGQEPARKMIEANHAISNDEIAVRLVRSVLFNIITRSRGTTKVYIGADDKEYRTAEEARASFAATAPKGPTPTEMAADLLATLVELGIPMTQAREKVREKYPEAFASHASDDTDTEAEVE